MELAALPTMRKQGFPAPAPTRTPHGQSSNHSAPSIAILHRPRSPHSIPRPHPRATPRSARNIRRSSRLCLESASPNPQRPAMPPPTDSPGPARVRRRPSLALPAGRHLRPGCIRGLLFAISHAGFSRALGTVSGTGRLWFDPATGPARRSMCVVARANDVAWATEKPRRWPGVLARYRAIRPRASFPGGSDPRTRPMPACCGELTLARGHPRRRHGRDLQRRQAPSDAAVPSHRGSFSRHPTLSHRDFRHHHRPGQA